MDAKYPDVTVRLTDADGNAFAILGRVVVALKHAGVPAQERDTYIEEAIAGSYDHLLQTTMQWVNTA